MTRIWNGSSTNPHTLPSACFCAGSEAGDFIELPCRHGGPELGPMHVGCLVSSFNSAEGGQPQPPRCPICRTPVEQNTLIQIFGYIRQNAPVSFPNEEDQEQTVRIYESLEDGLKLADILARARRLADGGDTIQPSPAEQQPGYWTNQRNEILQNAKDLINSFEGQEQTPENFDHMQAELNLIKERLIDLTGRATLFEHRADLFQEQGRTLLYFNVRQGLSSLGQHLEKVNGIFVFKETAPSLIEQAERANISVEGRQLTFEELDQKEAELATLKEDFKPIQEAFGNFSDLYPDRLKQTLQLIDHSIKGVHIQKASILGEHVAAINKTVEKGQLTFEELSQKEAELVALKERFKLIENAYGYVQNLYPDRLKQELQTLDRSIKDIYLKKMPMLTEHVTAIDAQIKAGTLSSNDLDQKGIELTELEKNFWIARRVFGNAYELYPETLKQAIHHLVLTRTTFRNLQGTTGNGETIWNGSDTHPHTLPNTCFCKGLQGGDFITLPCGHGSPEIGPMHVKCLTSSFLTPVIFNEPRPACCPTCHEPICQDILADLIGYVRRGAFVSYPGWRDQEQTMRIYGKFEDALKIVDALARAQRLADGGNDIQPTEEEQKTEYWKDESATIRKRGGELAREIEEQEQAPEDFSRIQSELDALKERLIDLTGRATLFEHNTSVFKSRGYSFPEPDSYKDVREKLSYAGRVLFGADSDLFVKKDFTPLVQQIATINTAIEEDKLAFEELDQKEAELKDLQKRCEHFKGTADVFYDVRYSYPLRTGLDLLGQTVDAFHEEKLALQRYQKDGLQALKTVWSGYDTDPLTKPSSCIMCGGARGGEFITLDCGHGAPGQSPLHVRCMLDHLKTPPRSYTDGPCPVCQTLIGSGTLARLAERAKDNRCVKYPGEDGTEKESYLIDESTEEFEEFEEFEEIEDISTIVEDLNRVVRARTRADIPMQAQEEEDAYYDQIIDDAKKTVARITANISDQAYTPEQLEADRFRLSRLEDRLHIIAGRTVLFHDCARSDDLSFDEIYDHLREVLDHVHLASRDARREQDMMTRRKEERAGHPQRVWNGFDTEPLTKPQSCMLCLGEFGGEFMSLDCGHGHPGNDPLHVRCLLDVASRAAQAETEVQCPICSASFSEEALLRLADCVGRNRDVRFPNDTGETETVRLFGDSDDQQRKKDEMLKSLVKLQTTRAGGSYKPDELHNDTYEHLIQEMEKLAHEAMTEIGEHAYTPDELEEKQRELDELDHRAAVAAGHAAQVTDRDGQSSFHEQYQRFLRARERLEDAAKKMRQEKKDMERREREDASHHLHPA